MKIANYVLIAAAGLFVTGLQAETTTVPNTFESGATASAAEVNANFTALASAIDTLATRVAALEEASSGGSEMTNLVAGRTYRFIEWQRNFEVQPDGANEAIAEYMWSNSGTISFGLSNDVSVSYVGKDTEVIQYQFGQDDGNGGTFWAYGGTSFNQFAPEIVQNETLPGYVQVGNLVEIDTSAPGEEPESITLVASKDGSILLNRILSAGEGFADTTFMVAVEIQPEVN